MSPAICILVKEDNYDAKPSFMSDCVCRRSAIFGFFRADLPPSWYKNRCFLVALCSLIVRRPNLEEATKSKTTRVVLVPRHAWMHIVTSNGMDISKVLWCHLLWQLSSQWGPKKLLQGLVSHELTDYLSDLYLFWLNKMMIASKCITLIHTNLQTLPISEVFLLISLDVNLS